MNPSELRVTSRWKCLPRPRAAIAHMQVTPPGVTDPRQPYRMSVKAKKCETRDFLTKEAAPSTVHERHVAPLVEISVLKVQIGV